MIGASSPAQHSRASPLVLAFKECVTLKKRQVTGTQSPPNTILAYLETTAIVAAAQGFPKLHSQILHTGRQRSIVKAVVRGWGYSYVEGLHVSQIYSKMSFMQICKEFMIPGLFVIVHA